MHLMYPGSEMGQNPYKKVAIHISQSYKKRTCIAYTFFIFISYMSFEHGWGGESSAFGGNPPFKNRSRMNTGHEAMMTVTAE